MTDTVLPADRRLRALLIGAVIAFALFSIVLYTYVLPSYLGYLTSLISEQPSRGMAEFQRFIDILIVTMVLCVAALAVYTALLGRKVLHSGQFPPPGARVVVATRILTGAAAVHRGRSLLLAAALIALLGLPGLLYVHAAMTDILATL